MNLNRISIIFTFLFFFAFLYKASAKHIIGGEITYVCNGNGSYTFTMFVYRDCDPTTGGADFDPEAYISIFEQNGNSYTSIRELEVIKTSEAQIPPPDDPCVIPPSNLCVEEAQYIFTVNLPVIDGSYHVVYQRCCRNNTITNIQNPEDSGATYTVEVTPEAQTLCNNSPVFNDFPPIVICVGSPLFFDHSASDTEGDQLVYEFCAPILGGGPLGTTENPGDASSCDGVRPMFPCAPPFDPVQYILSTYSELDPMGGNPQVTIDPVTGVISGVPNIIGQYVVGVCVSEYRNGVLLSQVRRDFQFNVSPCETTVDARVEFDSLISAQEFVINSCGNNTITFGNNSIQEQFIDEFFWTFDIGGTDETFTEWEPTITFPSVGTYTGILVLNPNDPDCNDTAFINVNVYPEIQADFTSAFDTCVAGPITFTDLSFSGAGPNAITDWLWSFENGIQGTSDEPSPVYMLNSPGNIPVSLTVTDENGCQDTELQLVPWTPAPPILIIEPSAAFGCAPQEVFFNNLSIPIDSTYDIVWDFGDGSGSGEVSPTHIYDEPGVYDISLQVTSPIGCFIEDAWQGLIVVRPAPIADFTFLPQEVNSFDPVVDFTDLSFEPSFWFWDFDGDGISYDQNPVFTFPDTGTQQITLIVTHASGCMDTLIQFLDVVPRVTYFVPNAFTPNSDGVNDFFIGNGITEGMENFTLTIWNRWGEEVFQTNDPHSGWNGKKRNIGRDSPNGVYVYVATYTGPRKNNFQLKGFATLIR